MVSIGLGFRWKNHGFKPGHIHVKAGWITEKEVSMGYAHGQPAALLFVDIFRQFLAHLWDGTLGVRTTEEPREIPHIYPILLLKVDMEEVFGVVQTSMREVEAGVPV